MGPVKVRKKRNQTPGVSPDSRAETQSGIPQTEEETPLVSGISDSAPAPVSAPSFKEKITVTLTDSGGLDLEGMRPKTKDRLVEALKNSAGGLFPVAPPMPVKRWPEIAVRAGYGFIGMGEVLLASRKYPPEIARTFFYTDEDIKVLMEPTQAVLARYAGTIKHEELITLGLAIAQIHMQKLHLINQAMADYEARMKAEKAAATAPGPAPGNENTPPAPEGLPTLN